MNADQQDFKYKEQTRKSLESEKYFSAVICENLRPNLNQYLI